MTRPLLLLALLPALLLLACSSAPRARKEVDRDRLRGEKARLYQAHLAGWPVPVEEVRIPTRFGATHALVAGPPDAPLLVCLHAMGTGAVSWRPNVAALSRRYRVCLPDTIGDASGSSRADGPVRLRRAGDYSLWVADLLDGLGRERAALLGCSMGGWIATLAARDLPGRVTRLALVSPAAGVPVGQRWGRVLLKIILDPSEPSLRAAFAFLLGDGPAHRELVDFTVAVAKLGAAESRLLTPSRMGDRDLRAIRCPVLLLIGDRESIYRDPARVFARARATLADLRTATIPGAGHLGHYDNPAFVDAAVLAFLD